MTQQLLTKGIIQHGNYDLSIMVQLILNFPVYRFSSFTFLKTILFSPPILVAFVHSIPQKQTNKLILRADPNVFHRYFFTFFGSYIIKKYRHETLKNYLFWDNKENLFSKKRKKRKKKTKTKNKTNKKIHEKIIERNKLFFDKNDNQKTIGSFF